MTVELIKIYSLYDYVERPMEYYSRDVEKLKEFCNELEGESLTWHDFISTSTRYKGKTVYISPDGGYLITDEDAIEVTDSEKTYILPLNYKINIITEI